jgi:polygalacturonase
MHLKKSSYRVGTVGMLAVALAACSSSSGSPTQDAGATGGSQGATGGKVGASGGAVGASGGTVGSSGGGIGTTGGTGPSNGTGGDMGASGGTVGASGGAPSSTGGSGAVTGSGGGGPVVTHTMADCDAVAASDSELVLPFSKTKVTKPTLPATPTAACVLIAAVSGPSETQTAVDTTRIAAALANSACPVVKLVASGANNAFISGPLDIKGPKVLWIDAGVTLYASLDASRFAYTSGGTRMNCGAQSFDEDCEATGGTQCTALINMTGSGPQLVGAGTIDGQGGKPIIVGGKQQTYSWWDLSVALRTDNDPTSNNNPGNCGSTAASQRGGSAPNPQLIVGGADSTGKSDKQTSNLVITGLKLQNSPKFHVKFFSQGFNIWGNTILTPSDKSISPVNARNTDGIDPGEGYVANNGSIVCNMISTGDDDVVLKGHYGVGNVVVAHNHFGTGHGMSIGSETQGVLGLTATDAASTTMTGVGVQDVDIYDITIDADTRKSGAALADVNGVRVKSDTYRGGIVQNVTFHDICTRDVDNPLIVNPHYSMKTTNPPLIPYFKGLTVKNLDAVLGSGPDGPVTPIVTLEGYDAAHPTNILLDNVTVQGITAANVLSDTYTHVTFGSQGANFAVPPSITTAGDPTGISCDWGWPVPVPQ